MADRQTIFKEAGGQTTRGNSQNPDFRARNIAKSGNQKKVEPESSADFSLMFGLAVFWDTATFLVGLIPAAGWLLNLIVVFPIGLLNMFLMSQSRGKSMKEFWGAFKYIFVEAVPYLNIIPTFVRGVWLLKNGDKVDGVMGAVNSASKLLGK
jgi:hypothetical protein